MSERSELRPLADLYVAAQRSFATMFRALSPAELQAVVPGCPEWTVRDVLSHVAGIPDDAFNGRLDGAASDRWTASQVERGQALPVEDLLQRWESQAGAFAAVIDAADEARPVIDLETHLHDVCGAVGRPADRRSAIVEFAGPVLVTGLDTDRDVTVELDDGRSWRHEGTGPALTLRGLTPFELFRSRLGRRSRQQVAAYDWSAEPGPVLDSWFAFGPRDSDLVE